MSTNIIFPAWRDETRLSNYPFEDGCTLTSNDGLTLPKDLFLDAVLYPVGVTGELYLSAIRVNTETRTITLCVGIPGSEDLITGTINMGNTGDTVSFYDTYGRPAGVLVSNAPGGTGSTLDLLASWGEGNHTFKKTATKFVGRVIVPMPQVGVRAIILESGEIFTGEVYVVGERGVTLRKIDGKLRVDILGEVLSKQRLCEDLNEQGAATQDLTGVPFVPLTMDVPNFLQTINGEGPNEDGTFYIQAGTNGANERPILRVNSDSKSVTLELLGGG